MKPRQKHALVLVRLVAPIVLTTVFATESVHGEQGDVAHLKAPVASRARMLSVDHM